MKTSVRMLIVSGVIYVIGSLIIVAAVNYTMRQQALQEAKSKAHILLYRNLATHTYLSLDLKPKVFELTNTYRPQDYFERAWMSSTFAVRKIDDYFKSLDSNNNLYYYKECAINARDPQNEADEYEVAFIRELHKDPTLKERSAIRYFNGTPYFVTLVRGEMMQEDCLRCHSNPAFAPQGLITRYGSERSFHRALGDVASAISMRIPLAGAYAEANRFSLHLSGYLLLIVLCLFGTQFYFSRRFVFKPLQGVRDRALQISTDPTRIGAEIPETTGIELRELSAAFNKMSGSLRQSIDILEARVRERTEEQEQLNKHLSDEIAERRQSEAELSRLAAIVESSDDAIIGESLDGTIISWNGGAERIYGYTPGEVKDRPISFLVPPDRADETPQILQSIKRGERVDHYETERIRKDGSLIDVSLTVSPIKNREDTIIGASIIARDITKHRQLERERERLIAELQDAITKVKTLSGLLPICSSCKKIRDDKGYWNQIELYLRENSEVEFTHGICPDCARKIYPYYFKEKKTDENTL